MRKGGEKSADGRKDRLNLGEQLLVTGILTKILQATLSCDPLPVVVAMVNRHGQGVSRGTNLSVHGITTGKIEKGLGIVRLKVHQQFIDLKPLSVGSPHEVIIAEQPKRFDVTGVSPDDPLEKPDLDVQFPHLLAAESLPGTALFGHVANPVAALEAS
jgi:hypothetical protein